MAEKETVLTLTYDLLLYATPHIGKYPRSHKFTVGERTQGLLLELLEVLVEAYYSPASGKRALLIRSNLLLEKLRYLFRLAKDLHCILLKTYELLSERVQAIGQQVGGWLKSLKP